MGAKLILYSIAHSISYSIIQFEVYMILHSKLVRVLGRIRSVESGDDYYGVISLGMSE